MEEEQSEFRHWDELLPDVLGLIFSYLSLKELLEVIPCVCKSWSKAVMGPLCWQYIDLFQWSIRWQPHQLDRMLRMLVARSSGSLRSLHVAGLQNESNFSFITENAGSLQVLRLPRSEISGPIVEETAPRLSTITFLDLSHCPKIGAKAIEAIGKHCKFLVTLCRNMHFLDSAGKVEPEDEANAIAATMPRLKHLELRCHFISTECVLNILSGCPHLEHLDIKGCLEVELDHQFLKDEFPKLKNLLELRLRSVGGPYIGYHEFIDWIYGFSYLRMWVECWLNGEIKLPLSVIECAIPCPSFILQYLLSM